jgi:hypothetical protein
MRIHVNPMRHGPPYAHTHAQHTYMRHGPPYASHRHACIIMRCIIMRHGPPYASCVLGPYYTYTYTSYKYTYTCAVLMNAHALRTMQRSCSSHALRMLYERACSTNYATLMLYCSTLTIQACAVLINAHVPPSPHLLPAPHPSPCLGSRVAARKLYLSLSPSLPLSHSMSLSLSLFLQSVAVPVTVPLSPCLRLNPTSISSFSVSVSVSFSVCLCLCHLQLKHLKVEFTRGDGAVKRREEQRQQAAKNNPSTTLFVVGFDHERIHTAGQSSKIPTP